MRYTIIDDRMQRVPLFQTGRREFVMAMVPSGDSMRDGKHARRVKRIGFLYFFVPSSFLLLTTTWLLPVAFPAASPLLLSSTAAIPAFTLMYFAGRSIGAELTSHQMLGKRRCASCGSPLRRRSPEADGCTVCPECGAAWRLADSSSS